MSRVGKLPIRLPKGVEAKIDGRHITVKGPKGELERTVPSGMTLSLEDGLIRVGRPSDEAKHRALHGLTRSLVANMVTGVDSGYERRLEIHGVGYRAEQKGRNLSLTVGFSHPVEVVPPEGVKLSLESPTLIRVEGIDKEKVGQMAAEIRKIRPPEPYKGKGIRYQGEHVRRKAGKATVAG